MKRLPTWLSASFIAIAALFFNGGVASADPNGNNGTVKIHATGTAVEDHRNEPHVCGFYLDFFNFDTGQEGTWTITGWAPTRDAGSASGSWGPADAQGNWHSGPISLPDGHYKLDVDTGRGDGKHKVFWVECGAPAGGGASSNDTGGNSTTTSDVTTNNATTSNVTTNSTTSNVTTSTTSTATTCSGGMIATFTPSGAVLFTDVCSFAAGVPSASGQAPAAAAGEADIPFSSGVTPAAAGAEDQTPFAGLSGLPSTSTAADLTALLLVVLPALGGCHIARGRAGA